MSDSQSMAALVAGSLAARMKHDATSKQLKDILATGRPCSSELDAAVEAWRAAVDYHTAVMQEGQTRTAEVMREHGQMAVRNQQLAAQNRQALANEKAMGARITELERQLKQAERKARK